MKKLCYRGMKLFRENCAGCHGDIGQPSYWGSNNFYPRVPQFADHHPIWSDAKCFRSLRTAFVIPRWAVGTECFRMQISGRRNVLEPVGLLTACRRRCLEKEEIGCDGLKLCFLLTLGNLNTVNHCLLEHYCHLLAVYKFVFPSR